MPSPATPGRRPLNLEPLETHVRTLKLRQGVEFPAGKRKLSLARDLFVPTLQADVGSVLPVSAYRYRLLVPVAQITQETATAVRRVRVATQDDVEALQEAFVRHFGGVTVHHQTPAAVRGIGARGPADVSGTLEQNEHVAFEVYSAPVQEADDYFRALRRELEEALQEGVILIERQQVTLV
jgi:hypothetical protein